MTQNKNLSGKKVKLPVQEEEDLMSVPEYMDKSLILISEALQKGFDVLQLENGDIVTTGVKTVVTTYRWDGKTRKMTQFSTEESIGANPMAPLIEPIRALGRKAGKGVKTGSKRK